MSPDFSISESDSPAAENPIYTNVPDDGNPVIDGDGDDGDQGPALDQHPFPRELSED